MRIAAIGDIHIDRAGSDGIATILKQISDTSDLLLLAGDLTELGLIEEAEILAEQLRACSVPIVGILGNHDHYAGHAGAINDILADAGVCMLEHEACERSGIAIAGAKGTCGGFDRMLNPIAEPEIVAFAQMSLHDSQKLDELLGTLPQQKRIVMLHHAPIRETIAGEHPEEYVFLGSSRYAEVIDRHMPDLVIHGHSHFGTFAGKTPAGVPVRNVAMPVEKPDGKAFAVFEM